MAEKGTAVQVAKEPTALKPPAPESFFDRANAIFNAISQRAYDIFESNGRSLGHDLDHWFQAETEFLHPVHIDVTESGDALNIKAEVPGFNEKELEINVEPRRLIIGGKREGKKEEKKGKTIYSETCSDQIMRVVDLSADGMATGSTMRAAIEGVKELEAARIIVAAGVAPLSIGMILRAELDDVICLLTPRDFRSVGAFYEEFPQLSDEDVCNLLEDAWRTGARLAA